MPYSSWPSVKAKYSPAGIVACSSLTLPDMGFSFIAKVTGSNVTSSQVKTQQINAPGKQISLTQFPPWFFHQLGGRSGQGAQHGGGDGARIRRLWFRFGGLGFRRGAPGRQLIAGGRVRARAGRTEVFALELEMGRHGRRVVQRQRVAADQGQPYRCKRQEVTHQSACHYQIWLHFAQSHRTWQANNY